MRVLWQEGMKSAPMHRKEAACAHAVLNRSACNLHRCNRLLTAVLTMWHTCGMIVICTCACSIFDGIVHDQRYHLLKKLHVLVQISLIPHDFYIIRTSKRRPFERYKPFVERIRTACVSAATFWGRGADFTHSCQRTRTHSFNSCLFSVQAIRTIYFACCTDEACMCACAFFCGLCT
jgi:hypothetical protein